MRVSREDLNAFGLGLATGLWVLAGFMVGQFLKAKAWR